MGFHLIDAEWPRHYVSTSELGRNLSFLREIASDLTLILTINARHLAAFDTARDYSEVIGQYENAGFCFVAGNRSYLSEEEQGLDAKARLTELVSMIRHRLDSAPIFVGSEGLGDLTLTLSREYLAFPFVLLDSSIQDKIANFRSSLTDDGSAVYCPCHLSVASEKKLIQTLGAYAVRRRWVRKALRKRGLRVAEVKSQISNGGVVDGSAAILLVNAVRELALCGTDAAVQRLRGLSSLGIRYVALLLAEDSPEEIREVRRLVSRFSS